MAQTATRSEGLARGSIGLPEVLFQAVTSMAPAGAVAFSIAAGAAYANGALTLAVIVALIGCITVAFSIGQLAQHLPSAGSIYTYPARGLHPYVGFLSGWGYAMIETIIGPLVALLFGYLIAGEITSNTNSIEYKVWWIIALIAASVAVFFLNYYGVRMTTETGVILGAIEITVFVLLSIWLIFKAGSNNTLAVFTTKYATAKGYSGFSGIFAGSVFTLLAFIGFEAATPLAEETRDPKRNIKLAAVFSCLLVGVYYIFTTYAATVYYGPSKFSTFQPLGGSTGPWVLLAHKVWGPLWFIVFLAILNSEVANQNAADAAASRTWFSMARIHLLPHVLARVHPEHRTPYIAVIGQFVVALVVGIPLGLKYGPYSAFVLLATILVAIMVLIYMVMNLSCIVYYARFHREEFNFFLHGVVPLAGILFLIPVWMASVGVGHQIFSFVSPLTSPANLAGPIAIAWYVIGVIYLIYLATQHPQRLADTQHVFEESESDDLTGTGPATQPSTIPS